MTTVKDILREIEEVERVMKLVDEKDFEKLKGIDGSRVSSFLWRYIGYLKGLKIADKEADE